MALCDVRVRVYQYHVIVIRLPYRPSLQLLPFHTDEGLVDEFQHTVGGVTDVDAIRWNEHYII